MAYKLLSSVLAMVFLFTILLAVAEQVIGIRDIGKMPKNVDVKQPEWFIKPDHNGVIPGIGPVVLPPGCKLHPFSPYGGSVGTGPGSLGAGSGSGRSIGAGSGSDGGIGAVPGSGGSVGAGSGSDGGIGAAPGSGGSTGNGSGSGGGIGTRPGSGGGIGSGSGSSYVPGGDDTFIPNPGFEVPSPGSGGQVPAEPHP
ncbi:putative cell wall protein [Carica papaya]|uniref:putative cell wall protein n=1 Tax=Carica papaya TaxID=3649 RepID=UPI000B8D18A2|nr:putative cell wall protein [Carica papaya]